MKDNLTILMIDDDEDDRFLFEQSVKDVDESINCVTLSNCLKAVEYLSNDSNKKPDYIFLDLRMPGYSGKQCLQMINDNKRTAQVPVIIYTTSTDVEDAEELKSLGAQHFMSKPTDPEEIYYMISQVINEKWV